MTMKVLVACEESQAVTIEFRKLGHEAYSCDLMECSGGHHEWHIKGDAILEAYSGKYDMMIAFPPCTFLTVTQNRWLKDQPPLKSGALVGEARREARREAIKFFKDLANAPIDKIALENPVGCMSSEYKQPTQIIQPYYFGDEHRKTTCLWLKELLPLYHNSQPNLFDSEVTHVDQGESSYWIDSKTGKHYIHEVFIKSKPLWQQLLEKVDLKQLYQERLKLWLKRFEEEFLSDKENYSQEAGDLFNEIEKNKNGTKGIRSCRYLVFGHYVVHSAAWF